MNDVEWENRFEDVRSEEPGKCEAEEIVRQVRSAPVQIRVCVTVMFARIQRCEEGRIADASAGCAGEAEKMPGEASFCIVFNPGQHTCRPIARPRCAAIRQCEEYGIGLRRRIGYLFISLF